MKLQLFGVDVPPSCGYCENGKSDCDNKAVFCKVYGSVNSDYHCRKFVYAPLKRIPKPAMPLQKYSKSDFEL